MKTSAESWVKVHNLLSLVLNIVCVTLKLTFSSFLYSFLSMGPGEGKKNYNKNLLINCICQIMLQIIIFYESWHCTIN